RLAPPSQFQSLAVGRYARHTPPHPKVSDFLLADGRRAALVPAASVAKELGMSEATVVRFAQALGFDGYPELRDRLRERFLTTATSLERFAASPAGSSAGRNGLLARILADDADAILGTLEIGRAHV